MLCFTGKGTPNHLATGGCPKKLGDDLLPHASQAADMYQQDVGSSLTRVSCFGTDPFSNEEDKISAEQRFAEGYPDISVLLDYVVNYNFAPSQDALLYLINITQQYAWKCQIKTSWFWIYCIFCYFHWIATKINHNQQYQCLNIDVLHQVNIFFESATWNTKNILYPLQLLNKSKIPTDFEQGN